METRMFTKFSKYIGFLADNEITADQFLLCYLLHLDKLEEENGITSEDERFEGLANLYKYVNSCGKEDPNQDGSYVAWSSNDIEHLIKKGFLIDKNENNRYLPDH